MHVLVWIHMFYVCVPVQGADPSIIINPIPSDHFGASEPNTGQQERIEFNTTNNPKKASVLSLE